MKKGDYPFPDDDAVIIPAGGNPGAGAGGDATLAGLDPDITPLMSTLHPQKLLRNDGSVATQIVKSVSVADPEVAKTNRAFDTGTRIFTIKSFLSANAVRATDAMRDRPSTSMPRLRKTSSITVAASASSPGRTRSREA